MVRLASSRLVHLQLYRIDSKIMPVEAKEFCENGAWSSPHALY